MICVPKRPLSSCTRAGSVVVAPDPLISLSVNSCLHALFISYLFYFFVLICSGFDTS